MQVEVGIGNSSWKNIEKISGSKTKHPWCTTTELHTCEKLKRRGQAIDGYVWKWGPNPQWNSHLETGLSDQQNHWVQLGTQHFQTNPCTLHFQTNPYVGNIGNDHPNYWEYFPIIVTIDCHSSDQAQNYQHSPVGCTIQIRLLHRCRPWILHHPRGSRRLRSAKRWPWKHRC